jgi:MerR family transcriptional regulator/heat shock protein HspR
VVNPGWADLDRGLFSISVAAELAGLHPQTLRIYEREGLLDPGRSAGGTRRYSRRDIDRLQEICALTADGLNLAGIRRVLQMQEETRELQAELARLRALADDRGASPPKAGTPRTGTPRPQTPRARPPAGRGTRSQPRLD